MSLLRFPVGCSGQQVSSVGGQPFAATVGARATRRQGRRLRGHHEARPRGARGVPSSSPDAAQHTRKRVHTRTHTGIRHVLLPATVMQPDIFR